MTAPLPRPGRQAAVRTHERPLAGMTMNGYLAALPGLTLVAGAALSFVVLPVGSPLAVALRVGLIVLGSMLLAGLYMLQPREAAIMTAVRRVRRHRPRRRPALGQPASTASARSRCAHATSTRRR
jgi:hypothetical protein